MLQGALDEYGENVSPVPKSFVGEEVSFKLPYKLLKSRSSDRSNVLTFSRIEV